jgi:hypothetical protein
MIVNCATDGDSWQARACVTAGSINFGVLIFFGFLTEYKTFQFEKDGTPIESYAMPTAVADTSICNLGLLVCAHSVDKSNTEEIFEVVAKDSATVAMVWLQKEKNASQQHFDPAAIYPTVVRHRACTSKRTINSVRNLITGAEASDNG